MDSEIGFTIIKNMIVQQNKELLRVLSSKYKGRLPSHEELCNKYIQPEYYLPIIQGQTYKGNERAS